MTLNLMLTSRHAVYLSGDFRLTSLKDQSPLPDSYDTQKLIPIIAQDWSALVAYSGVASAPPLFSDMGQWILEQVDSIPQHARFSEVSTRLLRLTRWLARIRGDRRVAFSVVGFQQQRPFMMLISNYVDFDGRVVDAGPQLRASLRIPNQAEVRAIGTRRPDVFERVRLQRLLMATSSRRTVADLIRRTVAEINAAVARRSKGAISEACMTGYLLRSGAAAIGAFGIPSQAACLPNWVRKDLQQRGITGFEPLAGVDGEAPPIQWKGMTAARVNGTIVRTHEIANAGKAIVNDAYFGVAGGLVGNPQLGTVQTVRL